MTFRTHLAHGLERLDHQDFVLVARFLSQKRDARVTGYNPVNSPLCNDEAGAGCT